MAIEKKYLAIAEARQRGAALVVILLTLVLFATLITGFLVATRLEQMASRNFSYQNIARNMAFAGAQYAIAQLNQASANEFVATRPGMLTTASMGASGLSNISLSSAALTNSGATNVFFNVGGVLSTNTNNLYFSAPEVPVETSIAGSNRVTGRFAYWVDDDGTKANLNAMTPGARSVFAATNSRPFGSGVFRSNLKQSNASDKFPITLTSTNAISNMWSYYFSPQQIANFYNNLGGSWNVLRADTFQLAAGPMNLTNAPSWFTNNRVNLNTELTTITNGGVRFARNFLTNAAGGAPLTSEIDGIIQNKIDRAAITNQVGKSFVGKYGQDVLRQIVVNINDFNLPTGTTENPGQSATTGGGNLNTEGIPLQFSGLKRFIHLNEIACKAAYSTNSPSGSKVEFQVWFLVELINPYSIAWGDAAQIKFKIDDFSADITYLDGGNSMQQTFTYAPQDGGSTGIDLTANIPATSNSTQSNGVQLTFGFEYQEGPPAIPITSSNISVTSISFRPVSIRLLQWANTDATVRDWAISQDFNQHGPGGILTFNNPPLVSGGINSPPNHLSPPDPSIQNFNTGSLGIAKNDPRVRTFPAWANPIPAWFPVGGNSTNALTLGSQNSVVKFTDVNITGLPGILPDRVSPPPASIFQHPSISNGFTAQNTNEIYRTLTDLGRVHTGLQWRTLHMAAQNPGEIAHIPDWALLESFYTTNQIAKLNVNSAHGSSTGSRPLATQAADGVLRHVPFVSLLNGGTNTSTPLGGFPAASRFSSTASTLTNLALAVSQMNFNPQWSGIRTSRSQYFPQNSYSMIGEVLQVQGLTDNATASDVVNEGRAATFLDAISTTSDVFSIYSVGYAVDRQGRDVGEYRLRTQVAFNPTTNRFETVYTEPVFVP
jgi:hypothetical protein